MRTRIVFALGMATIPFGNAEAEEEFDAGTEVSEGTEPKSRDLEFQFPGSSGTARMGCLDGTSTRVMLENSLLFERPRNPLSQADSAAAARLIAAAIARTAGIGQCRA